MVKQTNISEITSSFPECLTRGSDLFYLKDLTRPNGKAPWLIWHQINLHINYSKFNKHNIKKYIRIVKANIAAYSLYIK